MALRKGYFLDKWFRISDSIQDQKDEIFKRNNVPYLKLNMLPESELERWKELHARSIKVGEKMSKLILSI